MNDIPETYVFGLDHGIGGSKTGHVTVSRAVITPVDQRRTRIHAPLFMIYGLIRPRQEIWGQQPTPC